jgi:hypothetical protein
MDLSGPDGQAVRVGKPATFVRGRAELTQNLFHTASVADVVIAGVQQHERGFTGGTSWAVII